MPLPITSITASIAAIMLIVLSMITGMQRMKTGILLGPGSDEMLLRRIRAHGNFTEYVPIALILIGLAEGAGTSANVLWTMAGLLIFGRLLNAYSILSGKAVPFRPISMMATHASILTGVVVLLWR